MRLIYIREWGDRNRVLEAHLAEYKEKETKTKKLVGKEATELSPDK